MWYQYIYIHIDYEYVMYTYIYIYLFLIYDVYDVFVPSALLTFVKSMDGTQQLCHRILQLKPEQIPSSTWSNWLKWAEKGVFKPPSTMGSTSTTKTAMEEGFQRWLDRRSEDHFDGGTQVSTGYERDTMSNLRYPVISQSLGSNQTTRLGSSGLISSLGLELARPSVHRQVRVSQSLHLI